MICKRCNFKNPPNFKFCGNCGDSLSRLCPNCNHVNIQLAKFCNSCGELLANLCPNCRADNPKFVRFCCECGFQLDKVCPECRTINPLYANYCNSCGTSLPEITIPTTPPEPKESARIIEPIIQPPKAPEVSDKVQAEPLVSESPVQQEQLEIPSTDGITAPDEAQSLERESETNDDKLQMLENYIPPALREELYTYRGKIEGERKLVTTVFSDVSGFTALSEKYVDEPEEIQRIINECLKREIDEAYKLEGIPDKVIGDEVMALFGAPITHENDAERAIQAAMRMRETVKSYSNEIGIPLDVHIGINTGKVSVGSIGGQKLLNYTVIGDPVNLASRLEHKAEAGEIVVGELTYKLAKAKFDFEPPKYVELKNKTGLQPIYKLIGPKEHPQISRGIEGLTPPMVGREVEFETLMERAQKAMAGDFQIVSLTGEAGLGKSRLKRELQDALSDEVMWIEGQCQSHTKHVAYSAFLSAINSLFGVTALDTEEEIKSKITDAIIKMFDENAGISPADEILPYIINLMPIELSDEQAEKIEYLQENPEELQQQTFAAVRHILMRQIKYRPLILVLEDLHWVDEVSYELILFLLDNLAGTPTLLLNIYRPEIYSEDGAGDRLCLQLDNNIKAQFGDDKYTEIRLSPLSEGNMRLILDSMLNLESTQDSQKLKDMILSKSEGNPFYLEEVIRTLIEEVVIQLEEGGNGYIIVDSIEDIDVPVGIQAVVRARIDRVRGTPKQTLQHASVIGRNFPVKMLEYISPQDNLDKDLDILTNLDLIAKLQDSSELEYNFRHILTHETVYDSIIVGRKRELHGLVGNYIEKYYPKEPYLDQIVYHYRRSNQSDKAVGYLIEGGKKAQNLYSKSDAIDYYSEALQRIQEISEDKSQLQVIAHEGLGDVYGLDGQLDAALENYNKILDYSLPAESKAVVRRKMGEVYKNKGDNVTALEQYQTGLTELGDNERTPEAARILTEIGYIYSLDRKYQEAIQMNTQALEVIEGTEHYYIQALIYKNLGNVMCEKADYDRSIEYWEKSREILERFNARIDLAKLYNNFGELYLRRENQDKSLFYFQKSLEEREKLGDVNGLMASYEKFGRLYSNMEEFDKSLQFYERALEIAERMGNKRRIGLIINNIGSMYLRRKEAEKAIEYLEKAATIFAEEKNHIHPLYLPASLANIGDAYCELGNLDESIKYQNKALETFKQLNESTYISTAYYNLGKVYMKKQDYNTAIDYLHEALKISEDDEFWEMLGDAHRDFGESYVEKGNVEEAKVHLDKAIEIFEKLEKDTEIEKIKEIIKTTQMGE